LINAATMTNGHANVRMRVFRAKPTKSATANYFCTFSQKKQTATQVCVFKGVAVFSGCVNQCLANNVHVVSPVLRSSEHLFSA